MFTISQITSQHNALRHTHTNDASWLNIIPTYIEKFIKPLKSPKKMILIIPISYLICSQLIKFTHHLIPQSLKYRITMQKHYIIHF